mmetsp:Transcript_68931/g.114539  ORF Transcript_68931/g.114539 Transcript_68931/m.114539 type:complete len:123 (+) Transcript_68931:1-369(+)
MDSESSALAANAAFYRAFTQKDLTSMSALWLNDQCIACAHPGHPPLFGHENVMASWRQIFDSPDVQEVAPTNVHCRVSGAVARVTCIEELRPGDGRLVATNVFEYVNGAWCIVLHHAGPVMV